MRIYSNLLLLFDFLYIINANYIIDIVHKCNNEEISICNFDTNNKLNYNDFKEKVKQNCISIFSDDEIENLENWSVDNESVTVKYSKYTIEFKNSDNGSLPLDEESKVKYNNSNAKFEVIFNCEEGTFKDSGECRCKTCPSDCATCSSSNECTTCNEGFFLNNGTCQEGVLKCQKNNENNSINCTPGKYCRDTNKIFLGGEKSGSCEQIVNDEILIKKGDTNFYDTLGTFGDDDGFIYHCEEKDKGCTAVISSHQLIKTKIDGQQVLYECNNYGICATIDPSPGFYVGGNVTPDIPYSYSSLIKCINGDPFKCENISPPLNGYFLKANDVNEIIKCNGVECTIVTIIEDNCNNMSNIINNNGIKICLANNNSTNIPQTDNDLYVEINDFTNVDSDSKVIAKIGTDGSVIIEDGYYLYNDSEEIEAVLINSELNNNKGTSLYKCENNVCTSDLVASATPGVYINAANKKSLIRCNGSDTCELFTPLLGYYKTVNDKYVQCTGETNGCEEIPGSGTCENDDTIGRLNKDKELCLSNSDNGKTATFSKETLSYLIESDDMTLNQSKRDEPKPNIFATLINNKDGKTVLIKTNDNSMTINKDGGYYCVDEKTLEATPCVGDKCENGTLYGCNINGVCKENIIPSLGCTNNCASIEYSIDGVLRNDGICNINFVNFGIDDTISEITVSKKGNTLTIGNLKNGNEGVNDMIFDFNDIKNYIIINQNENSITEFSVKDSSNGRFSITIDNIESCDGLTVKQTYKLNPEINTYSLYQNKIPKKINKGFDQSLFGPSSNDIPYNILTWNINEGLEELRKECQIFIDYRNRIKEGNSNFFIWYLSIENINVNNKCDNPRFFEIIRKYFNNYEDYSNNVLGPYYEGYVLKKEKKVCHMDGIFKAGNLIEIYHEKKCDQSGGQNKHQVLCVIPSSGALNYDGFQESVISNCTRIFNQHVEEGEWDLKSDSISADFDYMNVKFTPFTGTSLPSQDINEFFGYTKKVNQFYLAQFNIEIKCKEEKEKPTYINNDCVCKECPYICEQCSFDSNNLTCSLSCSPGCELCSDLNTCTKCENGTYINDGNCEACSPGCELCTESNTCTKCKDGTYLNDGKCEVCSPGCELCSDSNTCTKCEDGTFINNGNCEACSSNCELCSSLDDCVKCKDGTFRNEENGKCEACSPGCELCTSLDNCIKCKDGTFINEGKCEACSSNCELCSSLDDCVKCKDGTFRNEENGKCEACSPGCELCTSLDNCIKCKDGTFINEGKCGVCSPGCELCSDSNTCTKCENGTYIKGGNCEACSPGCELCTESNTCTKCKDGTYLNDGKCEACLPGCELCSDLNTCTKCEDGTYIENGNCIACSPGCELCSGSNTCTKCKDGTYIENGKCQACSPNCEFCSGLDDCIKCKDGTFKKEGKCETCSPGCKYCSGPDDCTKCNDGTFINEGKCEACSPGCELCSGSNTCTKCKDGTYIENGKCQACSLNCELCSDLYDCIKCKEGTFKNEENGTCEVIDNCPINSYQKGEKCICNDGLYMNEDKTCEPCSPGCELCTSLDNCTKCKDGTFINEGICEACSPGCEYCSGPDDCTKCKDGTYIKEGKCEACSPNCELCSGSDDCIKCKAGTIKNEEKGICEVNDNCPINSYQKGEKCICNDGLYMNEDETCEPCSPGCELCTNLDNCTKCKDGTFINEGKCEACSPGCELCSDSNTCTKCKDGTYINNKICEACSPNCELCTGPNDCIKCKDGTFKNEEKGTCEVNDNCPINSYQKGQKCICNDGLYMNDNEKCEPCSPGCEYCSGPDDCTKCKDGTFINEGKCEACSPNCELCTGPNDCIKCKDGTFKNEEIGTCEACSPGCELCTSLDNCIKCNNGAFMKEGKCETCSPGCELCSDTNTCTKCKDGTYIKEGKCEVCSPGCELCSDSNACTKCENGTYINEGNCEACSPGCELCSDSNTCTKCKDGTYIKEGKCEVCSPGCELCSDSNTCTKCENGTYIKEGKCEVCSPGCELCSDSNTCTKCEDGTFINGGICEACSPNCEYCSGLDDCAKCKDGTLKNEENGTCEVNDKCPINSYQKGEKCVCNDGLYMNDNETCEPCSPGCELCTSLDSCIKCNNGTFIKEGKCEACSPGCELCTSLDNCTKCKDGTFINEGNCEACSPGCELCSDSNTCTKCENGTYIKEGKCEACSPNCEYCSGLDNCIKCKDGTFKNEEKGTCEVIDNCPINSYQKGEKCICNDGLFMNDNETCEPCSPGCELCTSLDNCIKCKDGTYINEGKCEACSPNCEYCSGLDNCIKCKDGTSKNEEKGTCEACSPGCELCTSLDNCIKCNDGTYIKEGKCEACSPGCELCSDSNTCTKCEDGTYINEGKCEACSPNCEYCSGPNECIKCKDGTFKNEEKGTCEACSPGCELCTSLDNCIKCKDGTFINEGRCKACSSNCELCSSQDDCVKCKDGTFKNEENGKCEEKGTCEIIDNCPLNSYQKGQKCVCVDGLYMNDNEICEPCSPGCENCSGPNDCSKCKDGTFIKEGKCEVCSPGCELCSDLNTCTKCEDGTYIKEGRCEACSPGCEYCSSPNNCVKCKDGTFKNIEKGTCEGCLPGCDLCSNGTECIKWKDNMNQCGNMNSCNQCIYLKGMNKCNHHGGYFIDSSDSDSSDSDSDSSDSDSESCNSGSSIENSNDEDSDKPTKISTNPTTTSDTKIKRIPTINAINAITSNSTVVKPFYPSILIIFVTMLLGFFL
ncbi:hypothetical protein U3516DRAFT_657675 [Neocallimastix sp. 'constans']